VPLKCLQGFELRLLEFSRLAASHSNRQRAKRHTLVCVPISNAFSILDKYRVLQGCRTLLVDTLVDSHALAVEVSIEAIKAGVAQEGDLMVVVAGKTFGHDTSCFLSLLGRDNGGHRGYRSPPGSPRLSRASKTFFSAFRIMLNWPQRKSRIDCSTYHFSSILRPVSPKAFVF
jgi:hypothetical protein